jgi:hypothetical protein
VTTQINPAEPILSLEMTELDEIKTKIADTERKLREAEEEAAKSGDFTRRNNLEILLAEQQKKKNFLLIGSGD